MKKNLLIVLIFILFSNCKNRDRIRLSIFPTTECGVMFIYGNNGSTNTQIMVRGNFDKSSFLKKLSKVDTVRNGIKLGLRDQVKFRFHDQTVKFTNDSLFLHYTYGIPDIYVVPVCLKYRKREFPDIYYDPSKVEYTNTMKLDGYEFTISSYYSEDLILDLKIHKW